MKRRNVTVDWKRPGNETVQTREQKPRELFDENSDFFCNNTYGTEVRISIDESHPNVKKRFEITFV